jgi:hypothetical protein
MLQKQINSAVSKAFNMQDGIKYESKAIRRLVTGEDIIFML